MSHIRVETFFPDKPYAQKIQIYVDGEWIERAYEIISDIEEAKTLGLEFRFEDVPGGKLMWVEFYANVRIEERDDGNKSVFLTELTKEEP